MKTRTTCEIHLKIVVELNLYSENISFSNNGRDNGIHTSTCYIFKQTHTLVLMRM